MSITRTITVAALRDMLAQVNRPQPIAFTALCEAPTKAAARDEVGRLLKLTRYRAWIGSYAGMVANRLEREHKDPTTFMAKPRKWGHHVSLALIKHRPADALTDKHYLSVQIKGTTSPLYLIEQTQRHLGHPLKRARLKAIAKERIAHLLKAKREEGVGQGLEQPIIHRDIDLSHITQVAFGGQLLKVVHDEPINPAPIAPYPQARPVRVSPSHPFDPSTVHDHPHDLDDHGDHR